MEKIIKVSNDDIERDLAYLLFYTTMCINDEDYKELKDKFENILDIVNKWIEYYSEDKNLKRITDEESITAHKILESIPFELQYKSIYYEFLETYLDIITYYPECPIDEEFDEESIERRKSE